MLNREIREGYKVVLAHVEKYVAAGDQIILGLLQQRNVELDKYRRQLIANLTYYEQHAEAYATNFDKFDLSGIRQRFVLAVKDNTPARTDEGIQGRILDAGCGTGRDTIEFIKLGYEVVAIDPSPAMLRYCNRKIREAMAVKETELAARASQSQEITFDEVSFRNEFDGIWAAASLLHIPTRLMPETLRNLFRALKPNGVLFFSLKYGMGEHEWDTRFYTYYGRLGIRDILHSISQAQEIATWLSDSEGKDLSEEQQAMAWNAEQSGRYDRSLWLNVLVRKARQ
jgi:SAM-dependent methyltransferase